MESVLVLLSGGMDSTVALADCVEKYGHDNVGAISFLYGQKHSKEMECALWQCHHYNVNHSIIDLAPFYENFKCCLLKHDGTPVVAGEYDTNQVPATYVPFRNGILISCATAKAYDKKYDAICISVHATDCPEQEGDEPVTAYPDCSVSFIGAMTNAVMTGTKGKVQLLAPFVNITKAEVARRGIGLGVRFEHTWSCYRGGDEPCGECGTCIERRKAFESLGLRAR